MMGRILIEKRKKVKAGYKETRTDGKRKFI